MRPVKEARAAARLECHGMCAPADFAPNCSATVASIGGLCETGTYLRRQAMKRTGSEMPSPAESATGTAGAAEIIERARLQADVAQQRVRLAKEELHRARKRLKEAKREARRARKYAQATRKDWKRARRRAKKNGGVGVAEGQEQSVQSTKLRRKPQRKSELKLAAARARRAQSRSSGKRGRRRAGARARK
jgi:hypothetical protein